MEYETSSVATILGFQLGDEEPRLKISELKRRLEEAGEPHSRVCTTIVIYRRLTNSQVNSTVLERATKVAHNIITSTTPPPKRETLEAFARCFQGTPSEDRILTEIELRLG
jgi:hypothetical protein